MQNYQIKNLAIEKKFQALKPEITDKLKFSWSNWGFGRESLESSLARLSKNKIEYIELHGNHYGADLGYKTKDVRLLLERYQMKVSGICGMFSRENDLASISNLARQTAIDYLRREIDFASEVGAQYILVVPGAVGRPNKYDDYELERSVETLQKVANNFFQAKIKAAIEPIRAAEVSFCHTIADAKEYLQAVNHVGIQHINGDVYHMQSQESHIATSLLDAGEKLANLHLADSNRAALGLGSMDYESIIMALHILQRKGGDFFVTAEPLGATGDPYPAMHSVNDGRELDDLVAQSISYFRQIEQELLSNEG